MVMSKISIRAVRPGDEPFLWEMLYESIHVEPGEAKPDREILHSPGLAHYLQGWGRQGDRAFIAEVDDHPVGSASYRLFPASDKGYGFIAEDVPELSVALAEQARGLGIGTRLMERLIGQAQADGYRGLSLSVDPQNPALRLYQRMGFAGVSTDEGGSLTMFKPLGA